MITIGIYYLTIYLLLSLGQAIIWRKFDLYSILFHSKEDGIIQAGIDLIKYELSILLPDRIPEQKNAIVQISIYHHVFQEPRLV